MVDMMAQGQELRRDCKPRRAASRTLHIEEETNKKHSKNGSVSKSCAEADVRVLPRKCAARTASKDEHMRASVSPTSVEAEGIAAPATSLAPQLGAGET